MNDHPLQWFYRYTLAYPHKLMEMPDDAASDDTFTQMLSIRQGMLDAIGDLWAEELVLLKKIEDKPPTESIMKRCTGVLRDKLYQTLRNHCLFDDDVQRAISIQDGYCSCDIGDDMNVPEEGESPSPQSRLEGDFGQ